MAIMVYLRTYPNGELGIHWADRAPYEYAYRDKAPAVRMTLKQARKHVDVSRRA